MVEFRKKITAAAAVVGLLLVSDTACVQAQDKGAPPWGEFLSQFKRDKLLKKPYHMEPAEGDLAGPKGLASKIRARELDVPNRIAAIRYLANLDCARFPEAKAMLLETLNPEKERWEEVRYEAALGLKKMLSRSNCSRANGNGPHSSDRSGSVFAKLSARQKAEQEMCHCTNCCDAETMQTLAKTAYEIKSNGCCYEPSLRVRKMAVEAISVCGIPCNFGPYQVEEIAPAPAGEVKPVPEETPPPVNGPEQAPAPEASEATQASAEPTSISRLEQLCVVNLAAGRAVLSNRQISAEHQGRLYFFASEDARKSFVAAPEKYAVAFGGCDPVEWVKSGRAEVGRYLVQHSGRRFMFASRENVEAFRSSPERFMPVTPAARNVASAR
jgi:YHS domain-containing protein